VAVVATILTAGPVAEADPPTTVAGLLGRYYDLSREAEKVNEELLRVQEDMATKRQASMQAAEHARAADSAAQAARDRAKTAREDMDRVTALLADRQTRRGMSALVTSTSHDDILVSVEAASLASQVSDRVSQYGGASLAEAERSASQAAHAQELATQSEAEVAGLAAQVGLRKAELDQQVAEVRAALDRLTPEQRLMLASSEYSSADIAIPSGDVGAVLEFIVGQLGKPYLWGATGPASYDCSGLMQTAFRVGGINLPRVSIQQAEVGQQVLRHDVRPGDLIFYYQPVHHVAVAVDNMRAVHAPSFGETVKVAGVDSIGPITVIRRVMR
jgi:cell wall-associated NlpC family hydrolase